MMNCFQGCVGVKWQCCWQEWGGKDSASTRSFPAYGVPGFRNQLVMPVRISTVRGPWDMWSTVCLVIPKGHGVGVSTTKTSTLCLRAAIDKQWNPRESFFLGPYIRPSRYAWQGYEGNNAWETNQISCACQQIRLAVCNLMYYFTCWNMQLECCSREFQHTTHLRGHYVITARTCLFFSRHLGLHHAIYSRAPPHSEAESTWP